MKKTRITPILTSIALTATGTVCAQSPPPPPGPGNSPEHGDPFAPVGTIQVSPTVVREGVQPGMTWGIEYPKSIPDLVIIGPAGGLTTTNPKPDTFGVRVVGMAEKPGCENLTVALWMRVGGSGAPWQLLFYGAGEDVDPSRFLYEKSIKDGVKIDFAARAKAQDGGWKNYQWTLQESSNIETLIHGDPAPLSTAAFTLGDTESFVTQFFADDSSVVLGPREILYLFELDSTPGNACFDLQDLGVVVSYTKNNNGHGNNLDGVDVSNPGQGHGGPNGEVDLSGSIDDEGKIKRKVK